MSEYCVYLKMPSYLRQWFIHRHGGNNPVQLIQGSIESKVLQRATVKLPENILPPRLQEGEVAIKLPYSKAHDPRTYNYLTAAGKSSMLVMIKSDFDIDLWNFLHDLGKLTRIQQKELIHLFMEQRGIKEDGTCFDAIAKIYQRLRNIYKTDENRKNRRKSLRQNL